MEGGGVSTLLTRNCLLYRVYTERYLFSNIKRNQLYYFMYRRPILWTLYGAVDFLKVLKIAVVAYIMSLLMMAGIKYWDVIYTLCPS
jgi:hypothetical protein